MSWYEYDAQMFEISTSSDLKLQQNEWGILIPRFLMVVDSPQTGKSACASMCVKLYVGADYIVG